MRSAIACGVFFSSLFDGIVHTSAVQQEEGDIMEDENDAIVGYLVIKEVGEDEVQFWDPEAGWNDDPDDGKLYETEEEAARDAEALRAGNNDTITVEPVFDEDEDEEDEDI